MAVHIPEDVVAAIELELFSEVLGKVPHGAWAGLLERLLRQHITQRTSTQGRVAEAPKLNYSSGGPGPVSDGG